MEEKKKSETPLKGFITEVALASLLREFYRNKILYMGTSNDLKALRDCCAAQADNSASTEIYDSILTYTTLTAALNAPLIMADTKKLQIDDPSLAAQLNRVGKMRFYGDDKLDLRIAAQNNPVSSKLYTLHCLKQDAADAQKAVKDANAELQRISSEPVFDAKARRAAADAVNKAEKRLPKVLQKYTDALQKMTDALDGRKPSDDLIDRVERVKEGSATVYTAQEGGYLYKCAKGNDYVVVTDVENPERTLTWKGSEQGVDVRHVEQAVSYLPELQAWSDEHLTKDDFGALLGFRLERVEPEELFPDMPLSANQKAALGLLDKDGNSRLYRIRPADTVKNLSMILTAYLPYLSANRKQQLEEKMALTAQQQTLFQNILDSSGIETETDADPLQVLDCAVDAVLDTKNHYTASAPQEPDFWYEIQYAKWVWGESAQDGSLLPQLQPILGADGKPKVISMLPYQIVGSEGKIYLSGLRLDMSNEQNYDEESGRWVLSNLRIDRILSLKKVTAESGGPLHADKHVCDLPTYYNRIVDDIDENMEYRNSSPKMFSGTPEMLALDCSPAITNVLVDTFGANALRLQYASQGPSPRKDAPQGLPEGWNRVIVNACWDGVRLFLLQNLENVRLADLPAQAEYRRQMHKLLCGARYAYEEE